MPDPIPTEDAREALKFTRALAAALQKPVEERPTVEISVVLPVFDEAANLPVLVERRVAALRGEDLETVFVDDGSHDGGSAG